jgi:hypothetical protein
MWAGADLPGQLTTYRAFGGYYCLPEDWDTSEKKTNF